MNGINVSKACCGKIDTFLLTGIDWYWALFWKLNLSPSNTWVPNSSFRSHLWVVPTFSQPSFFNLLNIFLHIFCFFNFEEETNYFINFIQTFLLFTFQTSAQIFLFLIFSSNFGFNVFQSGRSYFCSFQKTSDVMWLFHPSWQCLLVKYTIL